MQNMCQNVEAFKVNRLVYATFLSFFFFLNTELELDNMSYC